MEITLIKQLNGSFIPAFDSDKEIANKIKVGDPISGKFSKKRNYEFHKKYFALINLAYSNSILNESLTFEQFRGEITMRAGYSDSYIDFKGNLKYQPISISFAKMDDLEFEDLYSKCIDVILKYVLKGNTVEEIYDNIASFM